MAGGKENIEEQRLNKQKQPQRPQQLHNSFSDTCFKKALDYSGAFYLVTLLLLQNILNTLCADLINNSNYYFISPSQNMSAAINDEK